MTARRRRRIAWVALFGLLFQQLAMAAYVCPIETRGVLATASADLPPCHQQDNADRARCHEHGHPLAQSSDHAPAPTVPPALVPAATWSRETAATPDPIADAERSEVLARAAAPPVTVRDCTFQL
jgi:hypothetical protein